MTNPAVVAAFSYGAGQLPENITVASGGDVAVTLARSGQVATVSPAGVVDVVATFPDEAPDGSPIGYRLLTGIVAAGDHYEVLVSTDSAATTGLWRTKADGGMELIAPLPDAGLPNGLTVDSDTGARYAADSTGGAIYRIDAAGRAAIWATADELAPAGRLGVNGIKMHDGAIYAANFDRGTITRFPIRADGTAGEPTIVADSLAGIDDFAFTGRGDQIIAALNPSHTVVLIDDGAQSPVLTAADGLSGPTATLVVGVTVYVTSGAFNSGENPNLISATLTDE